MTDNVVLDFEGTGRVFGRILDTVPWNVFPPLQPSAPKIGIIVTPWCSCIIPWYSIAIGLLLRARGADVIYVWHDMCDYPARDIFLHESQIIGKLLTAKLAGMPIVQLSKLPPAELDDADRKDIADAGFCNALWWNHGMLPEDRFTQMIHHFSAMSEWILKNIKSLFQHVKLDKLFVPGGAFGSSGLYFSCASRSKIRVVTFDSGVGGVYVGVGSKAASMDDVSECMHRADSYLSPEEQRIAAGIGREIFDSRKEKKDSYMYNLQERVHQSIQLKSFSGDDSQYRYDAILPLNVEWDTGVMNMHRFFDNDRQWACQTVGHILEKTNASVAVRQHPGERNFNTGVPLEMALKKQFGDNNRFRFITCSEEVNTYKLIDCAKVVLPFTSTVGIEAAIMNVPVVIESKVYYANQPFVMAANSRNEYFSLIDKALAAPRQSRESYNDKALLCYFLSMRASCLSGSFSPHPPRTDWLGWDFPTIMKYSEADILARAIMEDKPVAMLQSGPIVKAHLAAEGSKIAPASPGPRSDSTTAQPEQLSAAVEKNIGRSGEPFAIFPNVTFGKDVQVLGTSNIEIGPGTCVGDETWLNICTRDGKTRLHIGEGVLLGRRNIISTAGFVEIGDFCMFGPQVSVNDAEPTFSDIYLPYSAQSPVGQAKLVIEENCRIDSGASVVGSLTVGRGSIVGVSAVVTQDVPPFSFVAGNPAKIVRMFNPAANEWQEALTKEQQDAIIADRDKAGIPSREQYRQLLRSKVGVADVSPFLTGRGNI